MAVDRGRDERKNVRMRQRPHHKAKAFPSTFFEISSINKEEPCDLASSRLYPLSPPSLSLSLSHPLTHYSLTNSQSVPRTLRAECIPLPNRNSKPSLPWSSARSVPKPHHNFRIYFSPVTHLSVPLGLLMLDFDIRTTLLPQLLCL